MPKLRHLVVTLLALVAIEVCAGNIEFDIASDKAQLAADEARYGDMVAILAAAIALEVQGYRKRLDHYSNGIPYQL